MVHIPRYGVDDITEVCSPFIDLLVPHILNEKVN